MVYYYNEHDYVILVFAVESSRREQNSELH